MSDSLNAFVKAAGLYRQDHEDTVVTALVGWAGFNPLTFVSFDRRESHAFLGVLQDEPLSPYEFNFETTPVLRSEG
jgi:hypothetical protein